MAKLTIGVSGIKPWGIRKVNIGKAPQGLTADKIRICLYFYKSKTHTLTLHYRAGLEGTTPRREINVH